MPDPNPAELGPLGDPEQCHEPIEVGELPATDATAMLEAMMRIRAAEERIADAATAGEVRCPCHLAIGQEAVAVGVARHVRDGDRVFGAHRSHGHYLALGGSVESLFAEVLGRETGCSRGMGGSMHLRDIANNFWGSVPIVGATIPIAVGAALAAQIDGGTALAVSFFGDGATEEGAFHEAMNLAAVKKLPVVFVCEHNLFSSHLHVSLRQPADSTCRYAVAHCLPWRRVDGNDAPAVAEAMAEAAEHARTKNGPFYLEAVTYRWRGHVGPREDLDVGVRRKDDLEIWKGRDPISRLAAGLGVEPNWDAARAEMEAAWVVAEAGAMPPARAHFKRVFV